MSETDLIRNILAALHRRGVWAWRANTGLLVLGEGPARRVLRGSPAGTPDILLVMPGGRLCGLEAKTKRGKQRPVQATWQAKAEAAGVGYAIVRSVSDALAAVERFGA